MAADPAILKLMSRIVDAARRPPIAKFRFAKVMRLTNAAMDRLRFAMPWCPGHATMANDRKAFFRMFDRVWCPSGPLHGVGVAASEAEQEAAAASADTAADAEAEAAEEDVAEEAEEAAAAEVGVGRLDSRADAFEAQALALLALEFPHPRHGKRVPENRSSPPAGLVERGESRSAQVVLALRVLDDRADRAHHHR